MGRTSVSIRGILLLFSVGALVIVLVAGITRARNADRRDQMTFVAIALDGAGMIEAESVGEPGDSFQRWSWVVIQRPEVLGVARFDPSGRLAEVHPADLSADVSPIDGEWAVREAAIAGLGEVRAFRALTSDRQSVVVIAANREPWSWIDWDWYLLVGTVIGACALGWIVTCMLIGRSIGRPIQMMVTALSDRGLREGETLPLKRRDAVGALARGIDRLMHTRAETDARASRLERTMDTQVAARTRQIEAMLRKAERRSWIDPLTKLGNRRLLDDRFEEVFAEQRRRGEDMSLIALDVDHFKQLNDQLGHAAGDELLQFTGELLRGSLRGTDIGLRLGGDEFLAILLGSDHVEAAETAERLVKLFGQRASVYDCRPKPQISAGVASINRAGAENGKALLHCADEALYAAKSAGKGRVVVAAHPGSYAAARR